MTAFRTRRIEAGDEAELNAVFNRFTRHRFRGRTRSLEQMQWTWHQAPGGKADSWIVEAKAGSSWNIVGHHALAPIRFTLGDEDWLCAKTMNSFLLPEYRDHFLYLRFEKECLEEAEQRFDATYSMARGTARLRRACGYEIEDTFLWLERGFQPHYLICRAVTYLAGVYSYRARVALARAIFSMGKAPYTPHSTIELTEITPDQAAASSFFWDFWTEARRDAGMAPRRDRADLEWRFWKRPQFVGSTLVFTGMAGDRAYFIVNTADPLFYSLEDFYMTCASGERLDSLMDALFDWCAMRGALSIKFMTSSRGLPAQWMEVILQKMRPFPIRRSRLTPAADLPRRLTSRGKTKIAKLPAWNYTPILLIDA